MKVTLKRSTIEAMAKKGLSQKAIGDKLGVSNSTIGRILNRVEGYDGDEIETHTKQRRSAVGHRADKSRNLRAAAAMMFEAMKEDGAISSVTIYDDGTVNVDRRQTDAFEVGDD